MSRLLPLISCLVVLASCGSEEPKSAASDRKATEKALAGSPPQLAKLHAQANQLLDGGPPAYRARLEQLRGHPVVVNKWGSWCAPCRAEFPFFQSQATKRGRGIAFLGVDVQDAERDARRFLRQYPVQYPSYKDPNLKIAAEMKAVAGTPATAFYDRDGKIAYIRFGGYATEEKLIEDIERYAR